MEGVPTVQIQLRRDTLRTGEMSEQLISEASPPTPPPPPPPSSSWTTSFKRRIEDVNRNATGPLNLCKRLGIVFQTSLIMTIVMEVMLVIPMSMIVLGAVYINDCPANDFIPFYLIMMGSFCIIKSLIDIKIRIQCHLSPPGKQSATTGSILENTLSHILTGFNLTFFISGSILIYMIYKPNMSIPEISDYCHPTLYLYAFWMSTAIYAAMGVGCFTLIVIVCLAFILFKPQSARP